MKIRIRDEETNEVLHEIFVDADDDRRDDIVKQVLGQFDGRSVVVDDSDDEDEAAEPEKAPADEATAATLSKHERRLTDEASASMASLTGDGAPVDAPPGIPAEGTTA